MWNDDTANEGGFDVSGYGSSPSVNSQDNKQSRKPNSLFPVAISQVLSNTEDTMTISGYPVSMMTIVGIVKGIDVSSTKISYTVEDWSGSIIGMLWLEGEGSEQKNSGVIENTYCRMTGTRRSQDGKSCMFIYNIRPIEDLKEITYHYLQVIHIGLKADEMRNTDVTQPAGLSSLGMNSNRVSSYSDSTMDNTGTPDGLTLTPNQRAVYCLLKTSMSDQGMSKTDLIQSLRGRVSVPEIEKAIQFLTDEGHAYNTVDDDHFKVTDS